MAAEPQSIEVTPEFEQALKAMREGRKPLLITGSAGVGKSTLLRLFRERMDGEPVVLAPTGVAAINVGGQTVHRFFEFGIDVTVHALNKSARKPRNPVLYKNLKTIVIDEVSMLRADLLDCVDVFLRKHGPHPGESFGGVHMIFIGDLYQLPPVVTGMDREALSQFYESPHFFSAHALGSVELGIIELTRVFRQRDRDFIELLHRVRKNTLRDDDIERLNQRVDPQFRPPDGQRYITLTGTNRKATDINQAHLDRLPAPPHHSDAEIWGKFDREYYPTDVHLRFKKGAQIMLLNNDSEQRWVNGSIGVIEQVAFEDEDEEEELVTVRLADSGDVVEVARHNWDLFRYEVHQGAIVSSPAGTFRQFPFRLAWAVTIHKAQGKTFERMVIDLERAFAAGQTYVALSRCTTLEGLVLIRPLKAGAIRCDWRVQKFLTDERVRQAEQTLSSQDKLGIIERAIAEGQMLELDYLTGKDVQGKRRVRPLKTGRVSWSDREFLALRAYCMLRRDERTFRIDRILALHPAPD